MQLVHRAGIFLTTMVAMAFGVSAFGAAPLGQAGAKQAPPLLQAMVGTWQVQQRIWPGPDAAAIELPPAIAHRSLVGDFVKEVMTPAPGSKQAPFTRNAVFNYNAVNQQYEYFSIDTRAPQIMLEKSYAADAADGGTLTLYGSTFVAPKWGNITNAAFRYRLTVGAVKDGRQLVRIYFTPLPATHAKEFLAMQYIYTRSHR